MMLNHKRKILILAALCVVGVAAIYYGMARNPAPDSVTSEAAAAAALKEAADRSLRETQDQVRMMKAQQAESGSQNQAGSR